MLVYVLYTHHHKNNALYTHVTWNRGSFNFRYIDIDIILHYHIFFYSLS